MLQSVKNGKERKKEAQFEKMTVQKGVVEFELVSFLSQIMHWNLVSQKVSFMQTLKYEDLDMQAYQIMHLAF